MLLRYVYVQYLLVQVDIIGESGIAGTILVFLMIAKLVIIIWEHQHQYLFVSQIVNLKAVQAVHHQAHQVAVAQVHHQAQAHQVVHHLHQAVQVAHHQPHLLLTTLPT